MDDESELFTIFPVFLLADVSASMSGPPLEALNRFLPELKAEMRANPIVGEIARVALVTFSDRADTVLPLCDLAFTDLPAVAAEGGTNFAAGLRGVRDAIETGMAALPKGTPVYRPVVFFLSDGEHQAREDWGPALDSVRDERWKFRPEIVAFGFGKANIEALRRIATRFAFLAKDADPAVQVREIMQAVIGSIRTTSASFRDPGQTEGLHVQAPPEYFTPLPPLRT